MIDIEALYDDVFNSGETDLEYFLRRGRELGVFKGDSESHIMGDADKKGEDCPDRSSP